MARIRTIKPEFWTDEKIVQFPFEVRLFFVGLWNFADDEGRLWYEPERIRMQIFPNDALDVQGMVELIVNEGLLDLFSLDGREAIQIKHFKDHQRIDKPSKSRIPISAAQRRYVAPDVRRSLAAKYGCPPGGQVPVGCHYCGEQTLMTWWKTQKGEPTRSSITLTSGFSWDHVVPISRGGLSLSANLVVSCKSCNSKKCDSFLLEHSRGFLEDSSTEGNGKEGKGLEGNGKEKNKSEEANLNFSVGTKKDGLSHFGIPAELIDLQRELNRRKQQGEFS